MRGTLAPNVEASSRADEREIDDVVGGDRDRCERSGTPGQRMAQQFLQQRKSTPALEGGKMRGGMRLAREDTPAFL